MTILLPIVGLAQHLGDTVLIYVDNRVEIKISTPDYDQLKSDKSIPYAIKELQNMIPEISAQLSSESAELVTYKVGEKLVVEPGDSQYTYLLKDGRLNNTGFRDRALILIDDYKVYILTTDLTEITDLSLSICVENTFSKLPPKSNWSKSLHYECKDESVVAIEEKNTENSQVDFLEFSAGVGAGLIKNEWVTDISFGVGAGFAKKGVLRHNPYISANMVFDFNTEDAIRINTFLNLGYRWNVTKKVGERNMLGVELGYLIVQQGDFFGENTFKLGLNWSPLSGVTVSPQLYFSDNLNTIYPAVRLGIGF